MSAVADTSLTCPSCARIGVHHAIFSNLTVHHYQCADCSATHVWSRADDSNEELLLVSHTSVTSDRKGSQYNFGRSYDIGDMIVHPVFGLGYILCLKSAEQEQMFPRSMDVLFADKIRNLVCGRKELGVAKTESAKLVIEAPMACPLCGDMEDPYNMFFDPQGAAVCCMYCKES